MKDFFFKVALVTWTESENGNVQYNSHDGASHN